jgi:hypothetical protein
VRTPPASTQSRTQIKSRPIHTPEPKFSNPVGKMTGMILFLESSLPNVFEGSIPKSVRRA